MNIEMLAGGLIVLSAVLVVVVVLLAILMRRRSPGGNVTVHSSIQQMREIGQLSVFKVINHQIRAQTAHSWGDIGAKYLTWVISEKKMVLIFDFEIDFSYDLRRPEFKIIGDGNKNFIINMPPCCHRLNIRDIKFYDEQNAKFLPWLLPDLINGFLPLGFSVEDKNKIINDAKMHAESQAKALINTLQSEVQNSAKATLQSISAAFGAQHVAFEFHPQGEIKLDAALSEKMAA